MNKKSSRSRVFRYHGGILKRGQEHADKIVRQDGIIKLCKRSRILEHRFRSRIKTRHELREQIFLR
jgi:hypothetical protein